MIAVCYKTYLLLDYRILRIAAIKNSGCADNAAVECIHLQLAIHNTLETIFTCRQ